MYQQTVIIGHLGGDPEFSYTERGVALCKFSVATSKSWGKGEARQTETTWFRCVFWREQAENIHSFLHKGSKVMVIGEIKASAYMDKNGKPAASLELTASQVVFLDSKGDDGERGRQPERAGSSYTPDEDVPF